MRHHADKTKDMARSILPSVWRHAATHRALLHRSARRAVNTQLATFTRDVAHWDDAEAPDAWLAPEISSLVSGRRGGDKLNHFMRWAAHRAEALPREQRLDHLRGLVPPGLIGEHALSHLERHRDFTLDPRPKWRKHLHLLDRGEVAELLRRIVVTVEGHRLLNEALTRGARFDLAQRRHGAGPRRLLGLHDVLPFLDALTKDRVARYVVDDFALAFKTTRSLALALTWATRPETLPTWDHEYRSTTSRDPTPLERRRARIRSLLFRS
jgi:hypothetical protein